MLIALLSAPHAHAREPQAGTFIFDGPVSELVRAPDGSVYVAGDFVRQQAPTGGGLILPAGGTGAPAPGTFPQVAGTVRAVVADGGGGWYVGGDFERVGGAKVRNLAHITRDGAVDQSWGPNPDRPVLALAVSGATLFAGGQFEHIGGRWRPHLAALDRSGALTAWAPDVPSWVTALAVSAGTLFVGGYFSEIGDQYRWHAAAFDVGSGALREFDPRPDEPPSAIAVAGSRVFLGGAFRYLDGMPVNRLGAVDAVTGDAVIGWSVWTDAPVHALAVDGSTLYVGGEFQSVGSRGRYGVAAVSVATGDVGTFAPALRGTMIHSLAVLGSTVYMGGERGYGSGLAGRALIAADAATGAIKSWDPMPGGTVHALAASGTEIYAGGDFAGAGPAIGEVQRVARIRADGSLDLAWGPNPDAPVYALALAAGKLYIGGVFQNAGGASHIGIAEVSPTTGAVSPWNLGSTFVWTLAASGTTVYVSGEFNAFLGQPRQNLAAFDAATGQLKQWSSKTDGYVYTLVPAGGDIFALGSYSIIGGQPRPGLAKLDGDSGNVSGWYAGEASSLAILGATTYLGAQGLRTVDAGGLPLGANIEALDGFVDALAASDSTLYAGGSFRTIGGQPRRGLAALNLATGAFTSWDPRPNGQVSRISLGPIPYAVGRFNAVAGRVTGPLAVLDLTPPETALDGAAFSADEESTFECSLDGAAFAACTSPASIPATGTHTLAVRAIDASGNVDPTPATATFTATPPPVIVDPPPVVEESPPARSGTGTGVQATKKPSTTISIPFRGGFQLGNISRAKACRGTISFELRNGKKLLDKRTAKLDKRCRFKVTFKAKRADVGTKKRLSVVVRFPGNRYLSRTTNRFTVKVPN